MSDFLIGPRTTSRPRTVASAAGEGHADLAATLQDLGLMYSRQLKRFDEAEPHLLAARDAYVATFGPDDKNSLDLAKNLAELYEAWGKPEKAAGYRARLEDATPPAP